MIYHQRNRNKYKGYKIVFFIFMLLIIFRIANIQFIVKIFDTPINYILESHIFVLQPFKNTIIYFKSKKNLEREINELRTENTNLMLENILNKTVSQEFEYFQKEFGTTTSGNLYKVILKPPFIPFDTIRIAGDLNQKQILDFVFYKNVLIGQITEKDSRYATVELFSTPNKSIPVSISGTQFEARGLGGGRYILEASKEFEVQSGDSIVYSDQHTYILGIVEVIESNEQDLFKKIYFNIPVPIESISYVTVSSYYE